MAAVHILEDFESIVSYGQNQNSMHIKPKIKTSDYGA